MRTIMWMFVAGAAGALLAPAAANAAVTLGEVFVGAYADVGDGVVSKSSSPGKTYFSIGPLQSGVTRDAHTAISRANGSAAAQTIVSATFPSRRSGSYSFDETASTSTTKSAATTTALTDGDVEYLFDLTGPTPYDITLTGRVTDSQSGDGSVGAFATFLENYSTGEILVDRSTTVGDSFSLTLTGLQSGQYDLETVNWLGTSSQSSGLNGLGSASTLGQFSFSITQGLPEPGTWAMMILGMAGVGAMVRRRRRSEAGLAPA